MAAELLHGLPPLIDERARVLILGSFPSTASLAARQYYAHPQNLFWRIVGEIIGRPLCEMDYTARCAAVQDAGIAIWDIYASCRREGSLDAAIRDAVANDLAALQKSASPYPDLLPKGEGVVSFPLPPGEGSRVRVALRRVCFNGRTAAKRVKEVAALGFEVIELPSTSPANAGIPYAEKLARWRVGLGR